MIKKYLSQVISNPQYRFVEQHSALEAAYLVIGKSEGIAKIGVHYTNWDPYKQSAQICIADAQSDIRMFIGGDFDRLKKFEAQLNNKPFDLVLGELEFELLKFG